MADFTVKEEPVAVPEDCKPPVVAAVKGEPQGEGLELASWIEEVKSVDLKVELDDATTSNQSNQDNATGRDRKRRRSRSPSPSKCGAGALSSPPEKERISCPELPVNPVTSGVTVQKEKRLKRDCGPAKEVDVVKDLNAAQVKLEDAQILDRARNNSPGRRVGDQSRSRSRSPVRRSPGEESSTSETDPSPSSCTQESALGSPLEALPTKLLARVLAYVPSVELLPLRLLSRRMSRLVLEKDVWERRVLTIGERQGRAPFAAILRLAPALDTLDIMMTKRGKELQGLVFLRALAEGSCQVRSLKLSVLAGGQSNRIVQDALYRRRFTLQELRIRITAISANSDLVPVLKAIDGLWGLKTLQLGLGSKCPDFCFKRLRLEHLIWPHCMNLNLAKSLMFLGRETIREVTLFNYSPLMRELQYCSKLTTLSVSSCASLDQIVHCVQYLTITDVFCPLTAVWLKSAQNQRLTVKIHLDANVSHEDSFRRFVGLADALHGVHRVTVRSRSLGPPLVKSELVAACLQLLPAVEHLLLDISTDFRHVLEFLTPWTCPKLRELVIREHDPSEKSTLVQEFKALRPSLVLRFL
ncbi:uncharacterized protein LOC117639472 isoform X2 [Thrips palmi]|uniref:Uncharacterized protein LOC117639472 isoform X2 n=1 Tax=Thrips palmi TaxID=161013 RepID=A0A6P8XVQ9_THRPL|nr:uncharacterized protein LOC117639472 isoform X2 [Thrips palmi]